MNMNQTDAQAALDDFSKWKEFLGNRVDQAQAAGMSEQQIADTAYRIGNYLSDKIDPKNPQERLLKQLWEAGDKNDQHALARMMTQMVQKHTSH
jgi:L-lysine 2,3-aminomutase